jgi:tetratricopeptide (TPR) repeat protein
MTLFSISSFAQDKIHIINGIIIEAKIQEVGTEVISYKKFNNPSAGIFNIKKSDVKMIVYENGEKAIFEQPTKTKNREERTNYLASVPNDASKNFDIIITSNGTEINCIIDVIDNYMISYHIKRSGTDPQGTISKAEVLKYFYRYQWFNVDGSNSSSSSPREIARNLINADKINKSISAYAKLVEVDSLNSLLLAEDAYALALGGVYDAALYRLDRSWSLGVKSSDVNFFTAQVFALMGYKDLADEFWKESIKNKKPKWISSNYNILLEKYKRKNQSTIKPTREELITKFKLANALAAQDMYFQSIALFQELTYYYPNEYLPYIGYSITLEKTGALSQSAKNIEKAISLIGNNPEEKVKKEVLIQRLKTINYRTSRLPESFLPGLNLPQNDNRAQTMLYAGGMIAPSLTNLNLKMGYFISGSSNASIDFGFTSRNEVPYTNLGLSIYTRSKSFVTGAGLLVNSGAGSTLAYLKLSVGISIMNKKRTSSFDTFLDVNQGLKKGSINTWGLSVGTSLYFGKRK